MIYIEEFVKVLIMQQNYFFNARKVHFSLYFQQNDSLCHLKTKTYEWILVACLRTIDEKVQFYFFEKYPKCVKV